MTGIEKGLQLAARAIDDKHVVAEAQQILRNWHHRLDKLTVLDGRARYEVQSHMRMLGEVLDEIHADDPKRASQRQLDARDRIESIRSGLVALVGERGLD